MLVLLAEGLTNRQIGEQLHLAEKTMKNYVHRVLSKIGMTRRTEAAVYAVRHSTRDTTSSEPLYVSGTRPLEASDPFGGRAVSVNVPAERVRSGFMLRNPRPSRGRVGRPDAVVFDAERQQPVDGGEADLDLGLACA